MSANYKIGNIHSLQHTIRYSLASLVHKYLINILFSLRVSGDLPNKFGRAAPEHAGLKINSTIRQCAFIHD